MLYSGKKFESWDTCESFIAIWAKQQGFRVIKDCVVRLDGIIRHRTYKALGSNTKSEQLINLLQEFVEDEESDF